MSTSGLSLTPLSSTKPAKQLQFVYVCAYCVSNKVEVK